MYSNTGNVAVEVFCVLESEADFFVYKLDNDFWLVKREALIVELGKPGQFVNGGDGGRSYMKLVKGDDFKSYSKKI